MRCRILATSLLALSVMAAPSACGGGGSSDKNRPPQIDPVPPQRVQAGQLLTIDLTVRDDSSPRPTLSGTISGPLLTTGQVLDFGQVEGIEFDIVPGRLELRIPPREMGPLEIVFKATDGRNPALETEETVPVTIDPPTLYDGILVDGVYDGFEAGLVAGSSQGGSATVQLFDVATLLPTITIAADYEAATDARNVYLRVTWEDATESRQFDLNTDLVPQNVDMIQLQLDGDGDGTYEDGEDLKACFTYLTGSGFIDQHFESNPANSQDDLSVNGVGRMDYEAISGTYTAELLLPRTGDPLGEDADLGPASTVPFNILFADAVGPASPATSFGGLFGLTAPDSSGWAALPVPPEIAGTYAPRATPSLGTLICISNHEDPAGEVYELDLSTGAMIRLTNNTRYEDWVSVAPDGSFAAYGSSPDKNDFLGYEIYKWERSTGLETALTSDAALDGHPGISPDNQRIVYVTFGASWTADIFIMDRDGGGVVRVTNNSVEENDPEWSKDGRLVIKASQWTGREQMAVMNEDGTNLFRLTSNFNSDHDGMVSPDNRWVLYERFEGTGIWNQDLNLTNSTPWTVRMVALDGSEERLLVENNLVNWLPVMGPEEVTVYFRSTAFNGLEVRMIDRFGVDLGRIAPDQSDIRYMDWK